MKKALALFSLKTDKILRMATGECEFFKYPGFDTKVPIPEDPITQKPEGSKRQLDFGGEKIAETSAEKKDWKSEETQKKQKIDATVKLLLQPMLGVALYLCKPCTMLSRAGQKTDLGDGKIALQVLMCRRCVDFNAELRVHQLNTIAFPNPK